MVFYLINIFVIIVFIGLYFVFKKLDKKWSKVDDYIGRVTHTVNSVRYGNLAAKLEKIEHPNYKSLSESINRMVETLNDREKMLVEYQNELTRQNKFLEAVINSLSDGILIVDEGYKILRITPKVALWFDDEGKNLIDKNVLDYIQPKENTKCEKFLEDEIFIKNSPNASFQATAMRLQLDDRKKRFVIILKEITSQKEIEKLREDFIATLTHDLKVPIIAEANILEFLLNGKFGDINQKQVQAIKNMKDSNNELLELVQIMLETYKVDESGIDLNQQSMELIPFIDSVIEDMRPIAEKSGLKITFGVKENLKVAADAIQLKRVVKNLIQNAISHGESQKGIEIVLKQGESCAKISIIDYGKGISQEEQGKIFNKYYSTAKKFRKIGTGLGLYLSQQIIKAHGGEITVKSEENVNTEFCINIPA